jgi:hypothetical protein
VKWDEEVDVVSTGSGIAGLAHAVAVVDMGGKVFVADSRDDIGPAGSSVAVRSRVSGLQCLQVDVPDADTSEYFAALLSDLGPFTRSAPNSDVPIRIVEHAEPVDPRGAVPPFFGARLRDWAARCVVSPYGYLCTRVTDWPSTTLRTVYGETLEVAEIGSITPDPANVSGSVTDWLNVQADDRDIEVHKATSLQRIVFEEGEVVGAVLATPDGPLALRARHGVIVTGGGPQGATAAAQSLPVSDGALRVCLVGQTASRFGRLELLTSGPLPRPAASNCRSANRELHASLHDPHSHLQTWRCGKGNGYPASAQ